VHVQLSSVRHGTVLSFESVLRSLVCCEGWQTVSYATQQTVLLCMLLVYADTKLPLKRKVNLQRCTA
jgi:dissimilatory sulfite reductase (desulfoviridin) alpha/beta subunit